MFIVVRTINNMVFIYALLLENNKYYIGKTNNPKFRLNAHFNNEGSIWTKIHIPIQINEIIPDCDDFDEDKITIKYMKKYGIDNVRGGSFCSKVLSHNDKIIIQKMINSSCNLCYNCGKIGHYFSECPTRIDKITGSNKDEKCDCPTSWFSPHRKSKCLLNNILDNAL